MAFKPVFKDRAGKAIRDCLLLSVFLVLPSFRMIFKYFPYPFLVSLLYTILFLTVCMTIHLCLNGKDRFHCRVLRWRMLSWMLAACFAAVSFFIYPVADARKLSGMGSTGDDAVIEPAKTLLECGRLYDTVLYDGAPVSPGPGWIILNAPFALLHIYWLMNTVYIIAAIIISRYYLEKCLPGNIVLVFLSVTLIFWELLVTGHDMFAMGFSFCMLTLSVWSENRETAPSASRIFLTGAVAGVISTARVVFLGVPMLLAVFLSKRHKRHAWIFLLTSLTVAGLLHGYFYAINTTYPPFHLFSTGKSMAGGGWSVIGLLMTALTVCIAYKRLDVSSGSWMMSVFICMAVPLSAVSLAQLGQTGWRFALWEGANYLAPAIPLLLFAKAAKMASIDAENTRIL